MAYIEFKNVSKIYKSGDIEVKALDNVSFEIEQGELVCILGHSGAGKTTALNILGGMDKATSGKITVARKEITKYNKKELIKYRRNNIGFVFQFYNLIQNLTALENVELATEICKNSLPPKETLINVGLKDRLDNLCVSEKDFNRKKKVLISNEIFAYENVENINDIIMDNIIYNNELEDDPIGIIKELNMETLLKLIKKIDISNASEVIVKK